MIDIIVIYTTIVFIYFKEYVMTVRDKKRNSITFYLTHHRFTQFSLVFEINYSRYIEKIEYSYLKAYTSECYLVRFGYLVFFLSSPRQYKDEIIDDFYF